MSKNQNLSFSIIRTIYKGRSCEFDLINIFEKLNLKGNIIEAKLKNRTEPIYNTEFFKFKQSLEKLFPIALELANKEMLENNERNVIYDEAKHYFELDYIEMQQNKDSILQVEFHIECMTDNREPLYIYDSRGNIYIEFTIENFDKVLETKVL